MNGIWPEILQVETLGLLSDEDFWNYAQQIAHIVPPEIHPNEYLRCELGGSYCLFPLSALYEVVSPPHRFTLFPAAPIWMPGILVWRGETIAVIDLAMYLSHNVRETNSVQSPAESILLVANYASLPIGLFVSAIELATTVVSEEEQLDVAAMLDEIVQQIRNGPRS